MILYRVLLSHPLWHGPFVQVHRSGGEYQRYNGEDDDIDNYREKVFPGKRIADKIGEIGERRAG